MDINKFFTAFLVGIMLFLYKKECDWSEKNLRDYGSKKDNDFMRLGKKVMAIAAVLLATGMALMFLGEKIERPWLNLVGKIIVYPTTAVVGYFHFKMLGIEGNLAYLADKERCEKK